MNRRGFLATTVAAAGAALAGCTERLGGADGGAGGIVGDSLPAYHRSLPAETVGGEPTEFVHVDVGRLVELGLFETPTETETPTEAATPTDDPAAPLLAGPVVGSLFALVFGFGFGLSRFGELGGRLGRLREGDADTDVTSVTFVADTVVVEGSFDADADAGDLPDSFTETGTRGEFTVYEDAGSELAVALSDDLLVLSFATEDDGVAGGEAVAHVLDVTVGEGERRADRSADDEWVLRTAGSHDFVVGSARDTEYDAGDGTVDPLAGTSLAGVDPTLLVSGASIDAFDGQVRRASSDLALTHTASPVERAALEDVYAESEADVSVSVADGDAEDTQRVHVSADFSDRSLGL